MAIGYTSAKYLIKNKELFQTGAEIASGMYKVLGKNSKPIFKLLFNNARKNLIVVRKMFASVKVSPKYVGKAALMGALTYGAIYLTYRGIKVGVKKLFFAKPTADKAEKVA